MQRCRDGGWESRCFWSRSPAGQPSTALRVHSALSSPSSELVACSSSTVEFVASEARETRSVRLERRAEPGRGGWGRAGQGRAGGAEGAEAGREGRERERGCGEA